MLESVEVTLLRNWFLNTFIEFIVFVHLITKKVLCFQDCLM